jgi:hypothetical protein
VPLGVALLLTSRLALTPATPTPTPAAEATAYRWSAPPECPDAAHVREEIEYYAARGLEKTGAVLSSADGSIVELPEGGYRLLLRMEVPQGTAVERTLQDESCEVLAETAALMIAATIDPSATSRPPPMREVRAPPPEPEPDPPPSPPPPSPPPMAKPPTPPVQRCDVGRSRLRERPADLRPCVGLDAHVGVQFGILPKIVGTGVGGDVSLSWSRLRLLLGASHWFRRPARVDDGRGGDLQLTHGTLGACARLGRAKVEVPLCGGAELGAMYGRGVGVDAPRSERVLWAAVWAGPRIAWLPVRRLALGAGVDLVIPLARYRFDIDGIGVVHRVGPVGGRIRVGLGVRL